MTKINRGDIQIISQNSNLTEKSINQTLKEKIYNDAAAWQKFLRLFFISLGIGFATAGIIFFFAYNWAELHKFIKIGLIEGLIVITTLIVLFSKLNLEIKNIILTGASVLVGVLFAVFGQIYQTGANAYDFFLGWTLSIMLWVIVSRYVPLWLLFITLINVTLLLYDNQVANHWSEHFVFSLLLIIDFLFLIFFIFISKLVGISKPPVWFLNLLVLVCISYGTLGIISGIYNEFELSFLILILITSTIYGFGIKYGLKIQSGFYLAVIPFSIIIIISSLLMKISEDAGMFLMITLFVVGSVTFVIKNLLNLQKKWNNG